MSAPLPFSVTGKRMVVLRLLRSYRKNWKAEWRTFGIISFCVFVLWLTQDTTTTIEPIPPAVTLSSEICSVKLMSSCISARLHVANTFTDIYRSSKWGSLPSSHTRSGAGSTIQGAFEAIVNLEPKFRELNISSIADIPSGDCGWQFSLPSINAAQAYFGGDITPHVVEENAQRFHSHHNKVFAFWDLVECPVPRWNTNCDVASHTFDLVMMRDVIQHMTIDSALKALKSVVLDSGATYLAVTSYSSEECQDQRLIAIDTDGDIYRNNLHCPPWNLPEPYYKFASHLQFPKEGDSMELYRRADLVAVVSAWSDVPSITSSKV